MGHGGGGLKVVIDDPSLGKDEVCLPASIGTRQGLVGPEFGDGGQGWRPGGGGHLWDLVFN